MSKSIVLEQLLDLLPEDMWIPLPVLEQHVNGDVGAYLRGKGVKGSLSMCFGIHSKKDRAPGGPKQTFIVYRSTSRGRRHRPCQRSSLLLPAPTRGP